MPFRDVIGHRRLIGLLARSVAGDQLPPSLIFSGPAGVGKRLTALATAQAFNCRNPIVSASSTFFKATSGAGLQAGERGAEAPRHDADASRDVIQDACGTCPTCSRIARGVHPDVIVIEPGESGSIKTEQVRDCIDRAAYRPFEGTRRVVIIDEADTLVVSAQNALLKTLEEPPSSSMFVLVSARSDLLLPTVRSRCPRLRFGPLGPESIAAALKARGHGESEARAIAASADGSLGRALEMSGSDLLEARAVAEQVLAGAGASDDPRRRIDSARAWATGTGGGGRSDRERLVSHLRAMSSLLRDVELLATDPDAGALAHADARPALEGLARVYRGERGLRAFSAIDRALVALDRNAGVKIVADWLVLQL